MLSPTLVAAAEPFQEVGLILYGTPNGCLVRLTKSVKAEESLQWDGACFEEYARGAGKLTILGKGGSIVMTSTGKMERGVQVDQWSETDNVARTTRLVNYQSASNQPAPASKPAAKAKAKMNKAKSKPADSPTEK